jgi:2-methylcitrate dehydratase PrpD
MDDIHSSSILHPGPIIIPAALAVAETFDCSIQDFLMAMIKGYEVMMRVGEEIGRSHYHYFHNTATCGAFGAALAVSALLKLDRQRTLWALGNAGSKTGGLWQMRNEKVLTKQWHNAETARSGLMAALLAKQGVSGPEYILEGPQGVFQGMSHDADPKLFLRKSSQWRIYDCSFKPWPACRHAHPAMDVFKQLVDAHHLTQDQIEQIEVGVYKDAQVFCDRLNPGTELEAKFSIQHALAAILQWGEPKLEHYAPEAYKSAACTRLRALIQLSEDCQLEQSYPNHFGAKCKILLKNGKSISAYQQDTLGDPEKPLTKQQRETKLSMLLTKAGVDEISVSKLCQFDWLQTGSVATLSKLLRYKGEVK